jgi:hypothetical protein
MIQFTVGAIADYAAETGFGKLTIVGIFNRFNVEPSDGPVFLAESSLVFVGSASLTDGTQHTAVIALEDADNTRITEISLPIEFVATGPGYPSLVHLILHLRNFSVPRVGDYAFRLRVLGKQCAEVPFTVTTRSELLGIGPNA